MIIGWVLKSDMCSRSKYYHFEEFLGQWLEKLKSADKTSMTVKLMKDIDRYRVSSSCFVCCEYGALMSG